VPDPEDRARFLDEFSDLLGIGRIASIEQRGRDPLTAPYTMTMADDRVVRIGTIKTFRSQPALGDVLAVTLGVMPPIIEPKLWHKSVLSVINHSVDVVETTGEGYVDAVREWLVVYCENMPFGRDEAIAHMHPFTQEDKGGGMEVCVSLTGLRTFLTQRWSLKEPQADLQGALVDLGFDRRTMNYNHRSVRSTRSYWVGPVESLEPPKEITR
jgi:hypothetical protein